MNNNNSSRRRRRRVERSGKRGQCETTVRVSALERSMRREASEITKGPRAGAMEASIRT